MVLSLNVMFICVVRFISLFGLYGSIEIELGGRHHIEFTEKCESHENPVINDIVSVSYDQNSQMKYKTNNYLLQLKRQGNLLTENRLILFNRG